jgi:IclR family acetate operon transcriptional repressor
MRLREVARPVLGQLAYATNETAHLAVLDGLDVVALDHVVGPRPVVARHPIGSRLPAHATAVGLAILAHVPEAVDAILEGGLEPWTTATIIEPRSLSRTLDAVRRRGYAVNIRGWHPETAGVAAAVFAAGGECVAAVGVSGPATRIGRGPQLAELARAALEASREISGRLLSEGREVGHFDGLSDLAAG